MASYKRDLLGVSEDGIWRNNKRTYSHILPLEQQQLNILPAIREEFWNWFRTRRITLHSDFHHLNSSQALCFNLFFPFMSGDGQPLMRFLDILGIDEKPKPGAAFEFKPDEAEGTHFDFMIPTWSGGRVFFEVKYTESDFGKAPADSRHIDKFERIYSKRLSQRFAEPFRSQTQFLANYQIVRNVWHLNNNPPDIAVFLFPKANDCLRRHEATIRNCALEPFRSRVDIAYLEDLWANLKRNQCCTTRETTTLSEFQRKYFSWCGHASAMTNS